jgi:hypothetical protein
MLSANFVPRIQVADGNSIAIQSGISFVCAVNYRPGCPCCIASLAHTKNEPLALTKGLIAPLVVKRDECRVWLIGLDSAALGLPAAHAITRRGVSARSFSASRNQRREHTCRLFFPAKGAVRFVDI